MGKVCLGLLVCFYDLILFLQFALYRGSGKPENRIYGLNADASGNSSCCRVLPGGLGTLFAWYHKKYVYPAVMEDIEIEMEGLPNIAGLSDGLSALDSSPSSKPAVGRGRVPVDDNTNFL